MARSKAPILIVSAACLWGTTGTAQALGPSGASSLSIGAARIVVGALGLLTLALFSDAGQLRAILWRRPVLIAAAGMAVYQPLFFSGVARTGVAVGTMITIGSAPVLTGLATIAISRRPLSGSWIRATTIALVGVTILVLSTSADSRIDPLGALMAFGAGGAYATYALATARVANEIEPKHLTAAVFSLAGLAMAPILVMSDLTWLADPKGLGVALWLGLGATALAYILYSRGMQTVSAPPRDAAHVPSV